MFHRLGSSEAPLLPFGNRRSILRSLEAPIEPVKRVAGGHRLPQLAPIAAVSVSVSVGRSLRGGQLVEVGWRIDYQLATGGIAAAAKAASVYKEQRFSDHAPLTVDYEMASV